MSNTRSRTLFDCGLKRVQESASNSKDSQVKRSRSCTSSQDSRDTTDTDVQTVQSTSATATSAEAKRNPQLRTVKRWQSKFRWLQFDVDKESFYVQRIWCSFCSQRPDVATKWLKAVGRIANTDSFINGTTNVKKTNVERHNNTEAHRKAKGIYNFVWLY